MSKDEEIKKTAKQIQESFRNYGNALLNGHTVVPPTLEDLELMLGKLIHRVSSPPPSKKEV